MGNKREKPVSGMYKRVGQLLGEHDMSVHELARLLGFNPYNNTTYERVIGYRQFKENEIVTICKKFNVSADWLLFGGEDDDR